MKQVITLVLAFVLFAQNSQSQSGTTNCENLQATYSTTESRCASTGTITISVTGGSGEYSYKILEPFTTPLTSTSQISGLPPGTYTVQAKDMVSGCTLVLENVVVAGSYSDPRFQLTKTDVSCTGGSDGAINVTGQQYGRAPLSYTIVAPSPAAIGTSNVSGVFSGLPPGYYYVQLRDSCGGIQTRSISVMDYSWSINARVITKINCNTVSVTIDLLDNRGNTNASGTAFNGFAYGVVNAPGDTTWNSTRSFNYVATPLRTLKFVVRDRCGNVQLFNWSNPVPSLGSNVTLSNQACATFTAQVTSPANLTSPQYYLREGLTPVANNNNGRFDNIPYGSYCIDMVDACYDTTITRCFTVTAPRPSLGATVNQTALTCSTFTAAVTSITNFFNPTYSIYTAGGIFVANSSNGTFTGLAYGDYCIRVRSNAPCYDTTIERCFTATQPRPAIPVNVTTNNITCAGFDASITGTYLSNPQFCLYNSVTNALIGCNGDGNFPGLEFGDYCVRITTQAPCYDTTIQRCFSVGQPQPSAADPVISARGCDDFTVRIPSVTNIASPEYCLFDAANNPLGCNSTGTFTNVPYGTYSIRIATTATGGSCPTSPVIKTFTVTRINPTANATVTVSNKDCSTFSADITGEANLINPHYYLVDLANNPIADNNTGTFHNIPYGSYKIIIRDACPSTNLERNVSAAGDPLVFTATAAESCTFTTTNIAVNVSGGRAPFLARILNPMNVVVATQTFSSASFTFADIAGLPAGMEYTIEITTDCGQTQVMNLAPRTSLFSRNNNVSSKCPSASWENGSGEIVTELVSNIGMYTPTIIRRNGSVVNIGPTLNQSISANHRRYTFSDLGPATYILEYNITTCARRVYDTIVVSNYIYPNLLNSAAYQCDNSNFSVNAVASNGVAPFTYEIIGSNPAGPSIVSPMQNSPVFNINTAAAYSLVRMRAVDACGNGTLNDVSVLPLGQLTIQVNNVDCWSNAITLSVDTIPNATYEWYKKTSATDSTLIGTTQSYQIPALYPSHTGIYVCKTVVNSGCLVRLSSYHLRGACSIVLPVKMLGFEGRLENNKVKLKWNVSDEKSVKEYQVERKSDNSSFEKIGTVTAENKGGTKLYPFTDANPGSGIIQYRLKIVALDGAVTYSNAVTIQRELDEITAGPNPVKDMLKISITGKTESAYEISLVSMNGQLILSQTTATTRTANLQIPRTSRMSPGMYILKIKNLGTGSLFTKKMLFE
ncbi:MAG: T9SS type A sorting domain-containing protein [Chitinophagaceae bacterium]|nr:MAG: T9SS type A sorting domain-containing protein [Chitinophagaceae bacterium]